LRLFDCVNGVFMYTAGSKRLVVCGRAALLDVLLLVLNALDGDTERSAHGMCTQGGGKAWTRVGHTVAA
jgi:hypothetical protein